MIWIRYSYWAGLCLGSWFSAVRCCLFNGCFLLSLSWVLHINKNVTTCWCVFLWHRLSSKGLTVLSQGTDWLQGQDTLFLSNPAPRSNVYCSVDKIRAPVWVRLLWNAAHPSSVCPPDVCTQQKVFLCQGEYRLLWLTLFCTCVIGFKSIRSSCSCGLYIDEPIVCYTLQSSKRSLGANSCIFSSRVNWHPCCSFILTDSCVDDENGT